MKSLDSQQHEELIKSDFFEDLILDSSSKAVGKTPTHTGEILHEDDEVEEQNCSKTPNNGEETTDDTNPRNSDNDDDDSSKALAKTETDIEKAILQEGDEGEEENHSEKPEGEKNINTDAWDENNVELKLQLNMHQSNASLDFPVSPINFVSGGGDDDDKPSGRRGFDLNLPVNYYYGGNKLDKKPRMKENNTVLGNPQAEGFCEDNNGLDLELRVGLSSERN